MKKLIEDLIQQKVEQLFEIEQDKIKSSKHTLKDLEKLEVETNAQLRILRYLLNANNHNQHLNSIKMKQQFKVGDTVRLKKNLKVWSCHNGLSLLPRMVFKGTATIISADEYMGFATIGNEYTYGFDMLIKEKP